MQKTLAVVNEQNLVAHPKTSTTAFRTFAWELLSDCETRKLKPVKSSMSHNWRLILYDHLLPLIGEIPLANVGNRTMKSLVERLSAKKSKFAPATIRNICLVAKLVQSSARDEDGNQLYPMKWNRKFIDAPEVENVAAVAPTSAMICWAESTPRPGTSVSRFTASWCWLSKLAVS
jgi:hypothetical protein